MSVCLSIGDVNFDPWGKAVPASFLQSKRTIFLYGNLRERHRGSVDILVLSRHSPSGFRRHCFWPKSMVTMMPTKLRSYTSTLLYILVNILWFQKELLLLSP